jgi:nicotinic acid mononucleotide adenylyltransferase
MSVSYTNNNTFIFSFVRMNPPTPGHLLVVESMINEALKLDVNRIFVILSNSMDDKNPIPCSLDTIPKPKTKKMEAIIAANPIDYAFKSEILREMVEVYKQEMIQKVSSEEEKAKISEMNVEIICSSGNPFGFIGSVLFKDFVERGVSDVNLFFIVGQDRAEFVDRVVDNFKTKDYIKSINAKILPREGMSALIKSGPGETSISDIPLEQYSASFVRKLVKNSKKTEFDEVYRPYLKQEQINKLYDTIANGLMIYEKPKKAAATADDEEEETPESMYIKNNILPIIKGGKKSRKIRKTRKSRKTRKTRKIRKTRKTRKTRK